MVCTMQKPAERRPKIYIGGLERALAALDRIARRRGREPALPAHLLIGSEGEDAAFFYLRRKGYVVVARRWSAGNLPGDLDLIAWQGALLCFIEVKTRTAHDMTPAEVAVDSHKRNTLRRLARRYVRQLPSPAAPQMRFDPARFNSVRFDVVSVYLVQGEPREFVHFENAFGWSEHRES
jgi:putative endonuclease